MTEISSFYYYALFLNFRTPLLSEPATPLTRVSFLIKLQALVAVSVLIVFDDMIAGMIRNKRVQPVVTELFIRGRKLNISLVFITQLYFPAPKDVGLITTHFFIMKIPSRLELQQIVINHSSDMTSTNLRGFAENVLHIHF